MSSPEQPQDNDAINSEMEKALDNMGQNSIDFDDLMNRKDGEPPQFVRGKVAGIAGKDVFIELGPRDQGVIAAADFGGTPRLGDVFDFVIVGKEADLFSLSRSEARELASWKEMEKGKVVSARVTGQNTGGLELKVGPIDAFMPASQVALVRIDDLSKFIGENMVCEVLEIERRRKRVTLSRRTVLERESRAARSEIVATLSPGQVVTGNVTRLEDFGAFVELSPGVEGLLHVSNISRARVNHPSERLKPGQKVEVAVLEISNGGKRIGLGMKQLEPDPWDTITQRYFAEAVVSGKVVRTAAFGAFVNLEDGIDGLVHVSQLGGERGRPVAEYAKVGEELTVRIVSVDADKQRISLSRLDSEGNVIGADTDAAPAAEVKEAAEDHRSTERGGGTNLGDLLRKALGD